MSFDDLLRKIGNQSVYNETELRNQYQSAANMNVYEMLYYGYFGEGHNKTMALCESPTTIPKTALLRYCTHLSESSMLKMKAALRAAMELDAA